MGAENVIISAITAATTALEVTPDVLENARAAFNTRLVPPGTRAGKYHYVDKMVKVYHV